RILPARVLCRRHGVLLSDPDLPVTPPPPAVARLQRWTQPQKFLANQLSRPLARFFFPFCQSQSVDRSQASLPPLLLRDVRAPIPGPIRPSLPTQRSVFPPHPVPPECARPPSSIPGWRCSCRR